MDRMENSVLARVLPADSSTYTPRAAASDGTSVAEGKTPMRYAIFRRSPLKPQARPTAKMSAGWATFFRSTLKTIERDRLGRVWDKTSPRSKSATTCQARPIRAALTITAAKFGCPDSDVTIRVET